MGLQLFLFSLKLQENSVISWKNVLIPYWFFFSIAMIITIGFAIIFVAKTYQRCFDLTIEICESINLKKIFDLNFILKF